MRVKEEDPCFTPPLLRLVLAKREKPMSAEGKNIWNPHSSQCHIWLIAATGSVVGARLQSKGAGWACGSVPAPRGGCRPSECQTGVCVRHERIRLAQRRLASMGYLHIHVPFISCSSADQTLGIFKFSEWLNMNLLGLIKTSGGKPHPEPSRVSLKSQLRR